MVEYKHVVVGPMPKHSSLNIRPGQHSLGFWLMFA